MVYSFFIFRFGTIDILSEESKIQHEDWFPRRKRYHPRMGGAIIVCGFLFAVVNQFKKGRWWTAKSSAKKLNMDSVKSRIVNFSMKGRSKLSQSLMNGQKPKICFSVCRSMIWLTSQGSTSETNVTLSVAWGYVILSAFFVISPYQQRVYRKR